MDKSVLRRLGGRPKVRQFCALDLEARQWINPYAVGFYDGRKYSDWIEDGYGCIRSALKHVLVPAYAGHWIYAHNGGNYDFLFLIRAMLEKEFRTRYYVELTPIGSCIVRMDVIERETERHREGCVDLKCKGCIAKKGEDVQLTWTFVDSARLMPLPLKDIGEAFNITKKVELEMSYDDLAKPENREVMRHYLKNDCVSLYEGVAKMQSEINKLGGQLGITLPATALDLFRRKYQRDDIATNRHYAGCPEFGVNREDGEPVECAGCMHPFIREAYFGGRSEIFRMCFNPYRDEKGQTIDSALMFDYNSHYPNCMLEPMPIGEAMQYENLSEQEIYSNARHYTGIVECDVEIPADCYLPPLPVRHHDKLVFPVGRLRGVWDTAELVLLRKVGGKIVRTGKSLWFDNAPIFVRFIRSLYKFRDKKRDGWTKGMDWIAKILMNSAYGKFAMRELRSRILVHPRSPNGLRCIDFDSDVWSEDVTVSPTYVVPQLSVHVTAIARARLWEALDRVIKGGGRIYYTDTDSVVCSGFALPTSGELGGLKQEAVIRRAEFVLPKLYLVETEEENAKKKLEKHLRIKAKGMGPGIRLSSQGDDEYDKQLSEREWVDLVRRGVPIQRTRLTKLREGLRDMAKSATTFPRIVQSPKSMQSKYDKRIVLGDYDTKPLELNHF